MLDNDDRQTCKRRVFEIIKPLCIEVSQYALVSNEAFLPNSPQLADSLQRLAERLDTLSLDEKQSCDTNVGDYLFYPLNHLLSKDSLGDRATQYLLEILSFILEFCWSLSLSTAQARNIYMLVTYLYNGPGSTPTMSKASDEVKVSSCRALSSLLKSVLSSQADITQILNSGSVSQTTAMLLDGVSTDNVSLQLAALSSLRILLCQSYNDPESLALMLPGVSSRIVKLLNGSLGVRCHFQVMSAGLDTLADIICQTCRDFSTTNVRTDAWRKATSEQLNVALGTLIKLRNHEKKQVILSLLHLSVSIIKTCSTCLQECVPILLDNVVYMAARGYDDAITALRDLVYQSDDMNQQLQNTAYNWILAVPRVVSTHDESQPVQAFNIIRESLGVLNVSSNSFLFDSFVKALNDSITFEAVAPTATASELAPAVEFLVQQRAGHSAMDITIEQQPTLADIGIVTPFSKSTEQALTRLLFELGNGSLATALIGHFIQHAQQNITNSSSVASLWMGLIVLRGRITMSKATDIETEQLVSTVIRLSSDYLQTTSEGESNIALRCLALEGLSLGAYFKGENFRLDLIEGLYPVVEMLADPSSTVAKRAQRCMFHLAQCCKYSDARELVVANADYLVDAVSIRLNTLDISPRTPELLRILLRLAGPRLVPFMDDLVETMFVLVDEYQGYDELTFGVFSVFSALVNQVQVQYGSSIQLCIESGANDIFSRGKTAIENLHFTSLEEANEYLTRKRDFSDLLEEPSDETVAEEKPQEDEDKWVSPVPKVSYHVVKHIIEYSDRYMTHEDPRFVNLLLNLVQLCTPILASQTEEFLPIVHQVWPALVAHVTSEDVTTVENTLKCIGHLCTYAADFMTSRISALWPQIQAILPPIRSLGPRFSREQRIFDALVPMMDSILRHCPVPPALFDTMLDAFAIYIPRSTSLEAAFSHINEDAVWLELARLLPQSLNVPQCSVPGRQFYPLSIAQQL